MKKLTIILLITLLIVPLFSEAYLGRIVPETITREEVDEMYPEGIENLARQKFRSLEREVNLMELELKILKLRFIVIVIEEKDHGELVNDIHNLGMKIRNINYDFIKLSYWVGLMDAIED